MQQTRQGLSPRLRQGIEEIGARALVREETGEHSVKAWTDQIYIELKAYIKAYRRLFRVPVWDLPLKGRVRRERLVLQIVSRDHHSFQAEKTEVMEVKMT